MRNVIDCFNGSAEGTFGAFPVWITFFVVGILLAKGMELVA